MGGKSKPTIGYWYSMLIHFGLGRGPLDALLAFRGGDKTAWEGEQTENGVIQVDAENLWGGEKAEGGIKGQLHVMMGAQDQMPSALLADVLGPDQSAYRGRATVIYNGRYGAFNPYPKAASFKVRRILKGWDGDVCWYPEKAEIAIPVPDTGPVAGYFRVEAGAQVFKNTDIYGYADTTFVGTGREIAMYAVAIRNVALPGTPRTFAEAYANDPVGYGPSIGAYSVEEGPSAGVAGIQAQRICPIGYASSVVGDASSALGPTNPSVVCTLNSDLLGMNPAHILYDSLTSADMQGEPLELINEASFAAAADRLFTEGFGLCTEYDPGSETVEAFQQRICNVIGANLSQSRTNSEYYLTLVRGDYDLESLPVLGDDDILEYSEETTDPLESVNQVSVEWFDPVKKEKRTTTPIQALGAIQAAGGVLSETISYPEIPSEDLALRVGARDLRQKSLPLKRFNLTTNRKPYNWRAGQFFRLQAPRRGIVDMVCVLGEIGAGVRRSGAMTLKALQDDSGMPTTTYVEGEPGVDTSAGSNPTVPENQAAFEASYVDLVASMTTAELAALAPDVGFLLAAAAQPSAGLNFDLWSRAAGEEFADGGSGDWCPGAVVVEAAGPSDTEFTLAQGTGLGDVVVGQAVLWGAEICRVDAIDTGAGTITLGRGCVDTVPQEHAAGEAILFYDGGAASDTREYTEGETVQARLRTRTSSQLLDLALAPTLEVEMSGRAARPYPPGRLRISDDLAPDVSYPSGAFGELEVTWVHRDRVLQADQLVDSGAGDVGPEAGTTYTVRYYLDGVLDETETGIAGTAATPYTLSGNGVGRVEVEAARDGFTSWQAAVAEFSYAVNTNDTRVVVGGDRRVIVGGDARTSRG